ncbi:MAG: hypothetical protein D6834_01520 [Aquificota bacterium]|nr:MAG: hypothetical protein D6834_01520 [Aquificota bacterium]
MKEIFLIYNKNRIIWIDKKRRIDMIEKIVENYLKTGQIDEEALEEMIRVGVRKGKKPKTDPKKRKKAKEYYKKHKAEILKKAKEYRKKNKKKLVAYAKAYRKKFGEAVEEKDWQGLLEQLQELLDMAEEIDAVLSVVISKAIDEIEAGQVEDEDFEEYKTMIEEIYDALIGEEEGDGDEETNDK